MNTKLLLFLILITLTFCHSAVAKTTPINFDIDGCYTGAYVNWQTVNDGNAWKTTEKDIKAFEKIIDKKVAIIKSYTAFSYAGKAIAFPQDTYQMITKHGSKFLLFWEPRDWDPKNPYNYNKSMLPDIISGKYDRYIDQWIKDIKALKQPIMICFAGEMNHQHFAWSGAQNGGEVSKNFGNPNRADGPEIYIAAYRYIHDRFSDAKINNVVWVWSPLKWGLPLKKWNHYTNYYPGDKYVDLIAMDEYNWGNSKSWSSWRSFNETYQQLYSELTQLYPKKPLIIGEFSSAEQGGNKAKWIKEAFYDLKTKYPQIKAFIWFHTDNRSVTVNNILEDIDWRIDSSKNSAQAAKQALADKYFIDTLR